MILKLSTFYVVKISPIHPLLWVGFLKTTEAQIRRAEVVLPSAFCQRSIIIYTELWVWAVETLQYLDPRLSELQLLKMGFPLY